MDMLWLLWNGHTKWNHVICNVCLKFDWLVRLHKGGGREVVIIMSRVLVNLLVKVDVCKTVHFKLQLHLHYLKWNPFWKEQLNLSLKLCFFIYIYYTIKHWKKWNMLSMESSFLFNINNLIIICCWELHHKHVYIEWCHNIIYPFLVDLLTVILLNKGLIGSFWRIFCVLNKFMALHSC